jgi:nitrite reductase (NADH) large subunit
MADVLASALAGRRARLGAQAAITRLKLDLTEVTVIGDPIAARHHRDLVWRSRGVYRRILLNGRRVVAAISVGFWDELAVLQQLAFRGGKLSTAALDRFEKEGLIGARETERGARALPDAAVVCQCANVSCGTLRKAIREGAADADALSRCTGAGTLCGGCKPLLVQLAGAGREPPASSGRLLSVAACVAIALAGLTIVAPRVPLSDSVLRARFDFLFTETAVKQWTGFMVIGVIAVGLLFSLRKRVGRFRWGSYTSLRVFHGLMGVAAVLGFFLHTGFRLGSNLNLALATLFLVSSITGAMAALALRFSGRLARACAAVLKRTHEVTFYPLPVLALFHALKSYYF